MSTLNEKIRSLFVKSFIPSFAEMAATTSTKKRFFIIIIFISCLFGFLYQVYEFSMIYLSYATEQKEYVTNPNYVELPAISFCNINSFKKSEICKMKEEYDMDALQSCQRNPETCAEWLRRINLACDYLFGKKFYHHGVWDLAEDFSHTESMFYSCFVVNGDERKECDFFKPDKKAFPVPDQGITIENNPTYCYTFNSAVGKPETVGKTLPKSSKIEIVLLTEFSEYPIPKTKPGLIIAIHDRRQLVNPFLSGDVLYGGDKYQLRIEKEIQTSLLPDPYDTNCTDYLSQWEQNDGTGPLDSQDCINNCILNNLISIESCIPDDFFVPHNQDICEDLARKNVDLDTYADSCVISCGNPCFERTYETRLLKEGESTCDSSTNDSLTNFQESQFCMYNNISLTLSFNQFMLTKITSVPRIQNQEIASSVGGYLRFWMGLSLLQFADFIVCSSSVLFYTITHLISERTDTIKPFEIGRVQKGKEMTPATDEAPSAVRSVLKKSFNSSGSESTKEKWIKLTTFLLSLSAFLYFSYDYTRQYLSNETVSIETIYKPLTIDRPVITICDANRRNRRQVCSEHPQKCEFLSSEEELCNKYPKYCNFDNIYYGVFKDNLACQDDCYTWEKAIAEFRGYVKTTKDNNYGNVDVAKVFKVVPFTDNEGESAFCVSYGLKYDFQFITKFNRSVADKNLEHPIFSEETTIQTWNDITFVLSLPADEYLDPLATPSVYFSLHDSSRIVNPFRYGIYIKAPGNHLIQVTDYIEQYLLPYPYDTNCQLLNLEEDTDENFDSMDCLENCNFNLHVDQYGCAPRSISISHMARLCKKGVKVTQRNNDICIKKCNRMPCISRMFKFKHLKNKILDKNYTYQEMKQKSIELYDISRNIMISVSFRNMKAKITKLVPKMVPIDLFSNIGGFLGIWIGSSLISISNLLYRLTDYVVFRVKKNKYWTAMTASPFIFCTKHFDYTNSTRNHTNMLETKIKFSDDQESILVMIRKSSDDQYFKTTMLTYTILFLAFFGNMPRAVTSFINEVKCYLADLNYFFFGSKNENIRYLFYSRKNPLDPCDLQPTTDALDTCKFNSSLDTKILLHGWIAGLPPESFLFPMKDDILDEGNVNVVIVNWTAYTANTDNGALGYGESALYSMYVGRKVSAWVAFFQRYAGADPKKFHFIPFSMGSEVTSFAAKTICNLSHITFLDPAAPLFRFLPSFFGPSYMDADFVEAIHTDAASSGFQGYGFIRPVADIDYYPNGGNLQPKCQENATFYYGDGSTGKVTDMGTSISCKHNSAFIYYLASFNKNCQFIGLICESYDDYLSGKCSATNATACKMGYHSHKIENLPPYSKCYLQTAAYPPYCLN